MIPPPHPEYPLVDLTPDIQDLICCPERGYPPPNNPLVDLTPDIQDLFGFQSDSSEIFGFRFGDCILIIYLILEYWCPHI